MPPPATRRALRLCDSIHETAAAAVRDADLVILCAPVGVCGEIAREIAPALKPGAILTDVGSVKAAIQRDVGPHVPGAVHFIPGHPIAGTEQSGPESGFAELFAGRWCILTPPPGSDAEAISRLEKFWRPAAPMSRSCRRSTTIWYSPSPAICRI
jgi:cyclohexadieny/prephenate dehydrogenase